MGAVLQRARAVAARTALAALVVGLGCGGGGGGGAAKTEQPAAAPAPAGAPAFERSWTGYVSRTYDGDLALCVDAAKAAFRTIGLEIVAEQGGIFEKSLEAEGEGTSVAAQVKEVTRGTTRVAVKVGYLLGDGDKARRIHSEIEAELDARRAEAEARKRRWGAGSRPAPTAAPGAAP